MVTVDSKTLAAIINRCFALSGDGRFSNEQQSSFLAEGKRLRGLLMNLLSASFEEGNETVLKANINLKKVNTQLQRDIDVLNNISGTLEQVSSLVKVLDKLLGLAVSFV
jgi:geranylgeranyl pyrophosphate synthase